MGVKNRAREFLQRKCENWTDVTLTITHLLSWKIPRQATAILTGELDWILPNQHCSKYYVTIPLCALGLPLMCYQAAFPQNCSVEMPFTIFRMVVFQKGVFEILSDTHSEIWLQKVIALVTRRLWVNSQSIRMFEI